MTIFQFADPLWLLAGLLLVPLLWLASRTGPDASILFPDTRPIEAAKDKRRMRPGRFLLALRVFALAALIIALARPQKGNSDETIEADGIDIVVTVDLSISMRALDLSTREDVVTRLDAAKRVVETFVEKRDYDRIALVAFAAEAFVVSPLTLNHDWLTRNLERLELGEIDGRGTAIGTALGASINRLRDDQERSRIVILLTDGENNRGDLTPLAAAEAAKTLGVKVYTIATGRKGQVPVAEVDRNGFIIRDESGAPIYRGRQEPSNYNTEELTAIAEMTGGQFFSASEDGDLEAIYDTIDQLETTSLELRSYARYVELFWIPAALSLLLILIEQTLRHTRFRKLP